MQTMQLKDSNFFHHEIFRHMHMDTKQASFVSKMPLQVADIFNRKYQTHTHTDTQRGTGVIAWMRCSNAKILNRKLSPPARWRKQQKGKKSLHKGEKESPQNPKKGIITKRSSTLSKGKQRNRHVEKEKNHRQKWKNEILRNGRTEITTEKKISQQKESWRAKKGKINHLQEGSEPTQNESTSKTKVNHPNFVLDRHQPRTLTKNAIARRGQGHKSHTSLQAHWHNQNLYEESTREVQAKNGGRSIEERNLLRRRIGEWSIDFCEKYTSYDHVRMAPRCCDLRNLGQMISLRSNIFLLSHKELEVTHTHFKNVGSHVCCIILARHQFHRTAQDRSDLHLDCMPGTGNFFGPQTCHDSTSSRWIT